MITLDEIKDIRFRRAGFGGYKPEDVENFIDKVVVAFETLLQDNSRLISELNVAKDKVSNYRKEEESIRKAILSAQKIADSSVLESEKQAKKIIADANHKADTILNELKRKIEKRENEYKNLNNKVNDFKTKVVDIYQRHIKEINEIFVDGISKNKNADFVKEDIFSK